MALGRKITLLILLIMGLAASCYVAGQRSRLECSNKNVELVLDYGEIQQIAAAMGKSPVDVLKSFKEAGATSVAISEQTFGNAIDDLLAIPVSANKYTLDPVLGPAIAKHLQMVLPLQSKFIKYVHTTGTAEQPAPAASYLIVPQNLNIDYLRQLPVGLPDDALKAVKQAGMEPVARLLNYTGASSESINLSLASIKELGVTKVIFQGDQILGFKGAVEDTAAAIQRYGLDFGRVEFSKQKGEELLAKKTQDRTIVVHSINQLEMPALDIPSVVERFARGVRERGVRMCYVRMYDTASGDMVKANALYVSKIAKGIRAEGYTLGDSKPLVELSVPKATRILAGVGVAAGTMLLILTVFDLSLAAAILWGLFFLAACAGMAAFGDMGRKAVALLSAMVFPTLAALIAVRCTYDPQKPASKPLLKGLARLVYAVAIVAAGGMLVVGLLSERAFMLRVDQFMGVKLAHLMPILILSLLFAGGIGWTRETWGVQRRKIVRTFKELAANPVLMWQALGTVVVLVLVAVMVARSGNDSGVGVSPLELKFRSILDKVLFVRPRTKEFLIGYPALLAGIVFALRGYRQWAAPLVVVGAIGLVSALNTFCHIHTPVMLSLLRVFNGLVVGGLCGTVVYLIVRNLPKPAEE